MAHLAPACWPVGQRPAPNFGIVTGISTGALIAPFAFLGPEQDEQLRKFYTTTSTEDIITKRTILSIIRGESTNDSEPLRDTLTEIFDQQMLAAIAAEHTKGRRLFVMGDLYRLYLHAQRDGIDYNPAYIPEDFTMKSKELFDPEYMNQLFDLGYRMAEIGYPWRKGPPGIEPP